MTSRVSPNDNSHRDPCRYQNSSQFKGHKRYDNFNWARGPSDPDAPWIRGVKSDRLENTWPRNVSLPTTSDTKTSKVAQQTLQIEEKFPTIGVVALPPPLSPDAKLETVEVYLDNWVADGEEAEGREKIKAPIIEFLKDETKTRLCFYTAGSLKELPDLWNVRAFAERLKIFTVSVSKVASLPPTMASLTSLKNFTFDNSRLTKVPEVGKMTSLEYLSLRSNQLTELPVQIVGFEKLSWVTVGGNSNLKLPRGLLEKEGCTVNTELD